LPLIRFLTIVGFAVLEFKAAVPAGLAMRLDPFSTWLAATLGATVDTVLVLFLGGKIRALILAKQPTRTSRREWLQKSYLRYGPAGLGLLAPLLVGTALGTALGVSLGLKPRRLLFWMVAGTALWSALFLAAALSGFAGLRHFSHW